MAPYRCNGCGQRFTVAPTVRWTSLVAGATVTFHSYECFQRACQTP